MVRHPEPRLRRELPVGRVWRVQRGGRLLAGRQREPGLRELRPPDAELPEHMPVGDVGGVHRVLRRRVQLFFFVGMLLPPHVHKQHLRFLSRSGRELLFEPGLLRLRVRIVGKMLR